MSLEQTASQTVGPYFCIGFDNNVITDIAVGAQGERIVIHGQVFDGAGAPVPDAVIETWQADANGRYPHPEDPQAAQAQPGFHGFMRALVNDQGEFTLTTIKPGRVPGPGGREQAPHLSVNVLMRGLLKQAPTRLYFSDETTANAEDPVLALLPAARRATVIATQRAPGAYRWELHMQGERETVFLFY